jgi:hypothetical protein
MTIKLIINRFKKGQDSETFRVESDWPYYKAGDFVTYKGESYRVTKTDVDLDESCVFVFCVNQEWE